MKEDIAYINDLIITYLAEGLEEESLIELNQWIEASQDNYAHFMELQEVWFSTIGANKDMAYNSGKAFKHFLERTRKVESKKKPFLISHKRIIYQVAAVAILLVVSLASYWHGQAKVENSFSDIIVEAPLGSKTKMNLPDGTLVWLNAGSKIVYSQGFGVNNRKVEFSGEGYFEVVKNSKNPFIVNAKELQVKVLGTKFNIRNYTDDEEVVVSLVEGRVRIDNLLKNNNVDYLSPDEKITLDKKTGIMAKSLTKSASFVEWTNDILFFDEELLPDIVKRLERNYNLKLEIRNEALNKERFYGSFSAREQTVDDVLNMLASTGRLKYEIKDKLIILY